MNLDVWGFQTNCPSLKKIGHAQERKVWKYALTVVVIVEISGTSNFSLWKSKTMLQILS